MKIIDASQLFCHVRAQAGALSEPLTFLPEREVMQSFLSQCLTDAKHFLTSNLVSCVRVTHCHFDNPKGLVE